MTPPTSRRESDPNLRWPKNGRMRRIAILLSFPFRNVKNVKENKVSHQSYPDFHSEDAEITFV